MKRIILLLALSLFALVNTDAQAVTQKIDNNQQAEYLPSFPFVSETGGLDIANYAPANLSGVFTIKYNATTNIEIYGLQSMPDGTVRLFVNESTNGSEIVFKKNDSAASPLNQFKLSDDAKIKAGHSTLLQYSAALGGWTVSQIK